MEYRIVHLLVMGRCAAVVGLVLLGFVHLSAGNKETCDLYGAVGQNLNITLVYEGLTSQHGLKWTHNNTAVYQRQKNKVTVGKIDDVSATGTLQLKNLTYSAAGTYQVNVMPPNNLDTRTWTSRLCVTDVVTKPQVTYVCDIKSVTLSCNVTAPQGSTFSWTLDRKTLPKETRQTLSFPLAQVKGKPLTCVVDNKASKSESDAVHPDCKSPPSPPPRQVCLPLRAFGALLAGGGVLMLVLLIIIFVLCCCRKRGGATKEREHKAELQMVSVNEKKFPSNGLDYETMQTTGGYPGPSPKPSPRACNKHGAEPDAQTENRPEQLNPASEELKASPVPKPRTKINQTPNI